MIIFSLLYGVISFSFSYYGEMLTYLGMTMPMAVFSYSEYDTKHHIRNNKLSGGVSDIPKKSVLCCLLCGE